MLVYGDWSDVADGSERLELLGKQVRSIASMCGGLERHALLVRALIEAGQLLQGVADQGWPTLAMSELVYGLASCVVCSFDSQFAHIGELPLVPALDLPNRIELRLPEGFAFYTVYPEAYIKSARQLRLVSPARVIGIRSIGTTLAAIVAAAIGAPPPITVRPFGDPFARKAELPAEVLQDDVHYVIVDEGPGLSGSSFGAVADWLQDRGVPLQRIAFLPSHSDALGPHASEVHRKRWQDAQRIAAVFEPDFLERRLGPLQAMAGGGPWQRTKYLAAKNGRRVLAKFAGLGSTGETKLAMARALHAAGFVPEPLGLFHGFLVEQWVDDARPIVRDDKLLTDAGRYLGARARLFAAEPGSGASIGRLLGMCRRNIDLGLGRTAGSLLRRFNAPDLEGRVRRVRTDNKLQPEEWLRREEGRLLKLDALDHHQAHDLIGCQSIEWDIAGFAEEFRLDRSEQEQLIGAVGLHIDRELLGFYRVAYAAFRLGQSALTADAESVDRYSRSVEHLLHQDS